jgi:hypothetical protein
VPVLYLFLQGSRRLFGHYLWIETDYLGCNLSAPD